MLIRVIVSLKIKPYEGSPYSSPHPPYSGDNNIQYASPDSTSAKKPLNPYTAVPPIHHTKLNIKPVGSGGSYVQAYQVSITLTFTVC